MNKKLISILFYFLLPILGYTQNNIKEIVLYALPFNSLVQYDVDVETFEKSYIPNREKGGMLNTTINDIDILSKFEKEIAKLKECDRSVDVRIFCYVHYSNGNQKTIAFGYDQQIFYDGKNYGRNPALFKTVKKILPKEMRKHVGRVRKVIRC